MLIRVSDIQDDGLTVDDPTALGAPYSDPAWRLEGVRLHLECDQADVLVTGEIRASGAPERERAPGPTEIV